MQALEFIFFLLFAAFVLALLVKHLNRWSVRLRHYMLGQANKVFGHGAGWERPWATVLNKAMVLFLGLMFIVFLSVVIFTNI